MYSREPVTDSPARSRVQVDQVAESDWNSLLEGFADASIYQTWAYGAVRWGESQLSHLVVLRDCMPVGLAQLRILKVPLLGAGVAYIRGGPACTRKEYDFDPAAWRATLEALVAEYVRKRKLTLRILPYVFGQDPVAEAVSAAVNRIGFAEHGGLRRYKTLRVNLQPSLQEIRAGLAHKWRNQLNAAERNGLDITEGGQPELFHEFTSLYLEMFARKRFKTSVAVSEFEEIQKRLPESQKMAVLIARKNGRLLCGLVASTIGTTGVYLLGATGDDGLKAKGSYLLQWRLLERLKEVGCHWYDLGGIDPKSNPGVYHFKQGLSGDEAVEIGPYDAHGSLLSRLTADFGERLRRLAERTRQR